MTPNLLNQSNTLSNNPFTPFNNQENNLSFFDRLGTSFSNGLESTNNFFNNINDWAADHQGLMNAGTFGLNAFNSINNFFNNRKLLQLAEDQYNFSKDMAIKNYNNQAKLTNMQIDDKYRFRGAVEHGDANYYKDQAEAAKIKV